MPAITRVAVVGACGKMGIEICRGIMKDPTTKLVGAVDLVNVGRDIGELVGLGRSGITVTSEISQSRFSERASVAIDFTHPSAVMKNVERCLEEGMHVVVGTSGFTEEGFQELEALAEKHGKNIFVAPNFAIGAVLLMKLSAIAARYMPNCEIIEFHHDMKVDAPSGTALATAAMLGEITRVERGKKKELIKLNGVRGGNLDGINVHSVRLPGLMAHQEVIFGGEGQTLTIRHDSISRTSFLPGILMAVKAIPHRKGLTVGLDKLLKM